MIRERSCGEPDAPPAGRSAAGPAVGKHDRHWHWFENVLAYDNARLPQAMIETGLATGNRAYIEAGLSSLRWLMALQTAPSGCFRPGRIGQLRQYSPDA